MKTTSKEMSQKLEEALLKEGYKFTNTFYHNKTIYGLYFSPIKELKNPAFTMCELWDMLPKSIEEYSLSVWEEENSLGNVRYEYGGFCNSYDLSDSFFEFYDNPCNALAKLAIWCIKNNHPLNLPKK